MVFFVGKGNYKNGVRNGFLAVLLEKMGQLESSGYLWQRWS
jgi:hypothetical protein